MNQLHHVTEARTCHVDYNLAAVRELFQQTKKVGLKICVRVSNAVIARRSRANL